MQHVQAKRYQLSSAFGQTFAALKHTNYRLWFFAMLVSSVGWWIQNTTQGYLLYELTESTAYQGYVGFIGGIPTVLFTLIGGVLADRFPRQRILIITQIAQMLLTAILTGLVFTRWVQPWHILVIAFLWGFTAAFDQPAKISFISELVSREDMVNAIALNSTVLNTATIIGPAIGGLIYALVGPGWCFLLTGLSIVAVIINLALMSVAQAPRHDLHHSARQELIDGVKYTFKQPTVRMMVIYIAIVSVFCYGVITIFPAWAKKILEGNSTTYGLLLSGRGVGALISGLWIATVSSRGKRGRIWTAGSFVMSVSLVIFAFIRWLPLSILVLVGYGLSLMALVNTLNTITQTTVPDDLRGRVMSVYMLMFSIGLPIGSLLYGWVGEWIGVANTILGGGGLFLVFAILTWILFPQMRRIE